MTTNGELAPEPIAASVQWNGTVLPALRLMAQAMFVLGPAPKERRCMARRCTSEATLLLTTIDASRAASQYPVRLCERCCNPPIDIFRWLSDGRMEAADV